MDSVLVDTSVWIALDRAGVPELGAIFERLRTEGRLRMSVIVLAELVAGAGSLEKAQGMQQLYDSLPRTNELVGDWYEAGVLRQRMLGRPPERGNRVPGLADCYLAVVAGKNHALIWTLDRAFDSLKSEGVRLYRP